jgi:antitoxin VapB
MSTRERSEQLLLTFRHGAHQPTSLVIPTRERSEPGGTCFSSCHPERSCRPHLRTATQSKNLRSFSPCHHSSDQVHGALDRSFRLAYTCVYAIKQQSIKEELVHRKAKIFMNNRSQAVRLPKDFQFNVQEVFIRKEGSDVVLSPRPSDWSSYLAEAPVASSSFMENVKDLPVQEREP